MLDTVTKLRAMGAEKRAHPLIYGEYPDNTKRASLEEALEKAKSRNWMAVPAGVKLQALEMAGKSEDIFKSFTQDLRERIHIGIEGATLQSMTGGKGIERGDTTVHKDTADLRKWHLSAVVTTLLNHPKDGLVRDIVNRNYTRPVNYPTACLGGIDDMELGETQKLWSQALKDGFPVSKKAYGKKFSMPVAEDDGDKMVPAPDSMGGSPAPPGGFADADPVSALTQPPNPLFIKDKGKPTAPAVAGATPFRFAEEWADYLSSVGVEE
jgi:hypothetical protein